MKHMKGTIPPLELEEPLKDRHYGSFEEHDFEKSGLKRRSLRCLLWSTGFIVLVAVIIIIIHVTSGTEPPIVDLFFLDVGEDRSQPVIGLPAFLPSGEFVSLKSRAWSTTAENFVKETAQSGDWEEVALVDMDGTLVDHTMDFWYWAILEKIGKYDVWTDDLQQEVEEWLNAQSVKHQDDPTICKLDTRVKEYIQGLKKRGVKLVLWTDRSAGSGEDSRLVQLMERHGVENLFELWIMSRHEKQPPVQWLAETGVVKKLYVIDDLATNLGGARMTAHSTNPDMEVFLISPQDIYMSQDLQREKQRLDNNEQGKRDTVDQDK